MNILAMSEIEPGIILKPLIPPANITDIIAAVATGAKNSVN